MKTQFNGIVLSTSIILLFLTLGQAFGNSPNRGLFTDTIKVKKNIPQLNTVSLDLGGFIFSWYQ